MNQPAHKTEGVNRTQNMRSYPFVFTGKEKDPETGYGYFGARYMDHELMTMWLSVDPMADKYPGITTAIGIQLYLLIPMEEIGIKPRMEVFVIQNNILQRRVF